MNIFVLDNDLRACARAHTNAHIVKQMLESAQILSTVCRESGLDCGYKSTHKHHPCVKWASKSIQNWKWLRDLAYELNHEWKYRFNHDHDSKSIEMIKTLEEPDLPDIGMTPFALAMPDEYKTNNPVKSYRLYYMGGKRHLANWGIREQPEWFE